MCIVTSRATLFVSLMLLTVLATAGLKAEKDNKETHVWSRLNKDPGRLVAKDHAHRHERVKRHVIEDDTFDQRDDRQDESLANEVNRRPRDVTAAPEDQKDSSVQPPKVDYVSQISSCANRLTFISITITTLNRICRITKLPWKY